jgi:hypothetical protein
VRAKLESLITTLSTDVPGIRIGVIAHGDYCDADSSYVIKFLPLMTDYAKLTKFVAEVGPTHGGDAPECYELALNKALNKMNWSDDAKARALVLVGDDVPHEKGYSYGGKTVNIDWRNQLKGLVNRYNVQIYAVQAGSSTGAKPFYETLATESRGRYLALNDINLMQDLIAAVCLHSTGDERLLNAYEKRVRREGRMTASAATIFTEIRKTIVVVLG